MTKPTGRPRGRPKTKEYVTLMARVPLELVDQVRRYASLHRQSMSDVLRDGLQLLLDEESTAPRYVYDRNTPPAKMSDMKEAPLPLDTPNPVIVSDIEEAMSAALVDTPAQQSTYVYDTKEAPPVLSFDTTRYILGKLCPRGHAWGNTGQSLLRRTNRHCCACDREKFQERGKVQRQARRQQQRQKEVQG